MNGQQVCEKHGGRAPQNLAAAERRLATHADVLMKELLRIATSAESEAVRLAAVKDALDRIGIGTKKEVTVNLDKWQIDIEGLLVDVQDADTSSAPTGPAPLPHGQVIAGELGRKQDDDAYTVTTLPSLVDDPPKYGRGNRLS